MADYISEWEKREREAVAASKAKLLSSETLAKLKGLGVGAVVVKYDGSGDEGGIDGTYFLTYVPDDADDVGKSDVEVSAETEAELFGGTDDAFYPLLPGGFEINEGGRGAVVLDVEAGTITRHHADYVESTEWRGAESL